MIVDKDLYNTLTKADSQWQTRKRKITTASIFASLCSACTSKKGFEHILESERSEFTPQALGRARAKLPEHLFLEINKYMQRSLKGSNRIFAIDGSKVHVHPSFKKFEYKTRTNDKPVSRPAIRPIAMLSSMLDVESQTCFDAIITKHFNERVSAMHHLKCAKSGDTLLFDRGYFSTKLLTEADKVNVKVVFRLKRTALKCVQSFYNGCETKRNIFIVNSDESRTKAYLYKYFIDGKKYICLTNFETNSNTVRKLYAKRWKVETSFRRLKTDLNLEVCHSMTDSGFVQEVEARILLDTAAKLSEKFPCCNFKKRDNTYHKRIERIVEVLYAIKICSELNLKFNSFQKIFQKIVLEKENSNYSIDHIF